MPFYIGFDFSINKPACTILDSVGKIVNQYFWPLNLSESLVELYKSLDIKIVNRDLPSISKELYKNKNHELVREHTRRSKELSKLICSDIKTFTDKYQNDDFYFASEGLSFNSKGSSYIDLATYKGVFLSDLSEIYSLDSIYTYSPLTLKATAGCNKGPNRTRKNKMIEAFKEQDFTNNNSKNKFYIACSDDSLKNQVNYKIGVDDLVDSYFCALTLLRDKQ